MSKVTEIAAPHGVSGIAQVAASHDPSGDSPALDATDAARLRAELVRFFARRTRDVALREDLAQEALVHVVRGLAQVRRSAALGAWARRIALNVWRDHLRRAAARPPERAVRGDAFSVTALLDALEPAQPAPSAEDVYDRRATHDCLLRALRRLPVASRRIVLLHDFAETSLDETAAALGCATGAAKVRLHRARRRLAELCRAECGHDVGLDGALLCAPKKKEKGGRDHGDLP